MNDIYNFINDLLKNNDYLLIQQGIVEIYYEIGKYIIEENYNIFKMEDNLRKEYGLLIGFTRRNIKNMIKFYKTYKDYDINVLKKIPWDNHLIILKTNNKDELLNYCLKYNIDKYDLKKILKKGFDEKYINCKVIENDIVTLEIIKIISSKNV